MCNNNFHQISKKRSGRQVYFVFVTLVLVFFYMPALAHKVMIFAWVEDDTVYTQSKFSGGKKVKGAPVLVFDSRGTQMLEGKTDEKGMFSFKIPQKDDLKVVLQASMGHRAEWLIPAKEIILAQSPESSISETDDKAVTNKSFVSAGVKAIRELPGATTNSLQKKEIRELIDVSLDKKLAPIINMLVNAQEQGPRITDVIGGIGYIFGLVGIALYIATRRKKE